jgi:uncharacterized protein YndB with AHSA1/START domain
MTLPDRVAAEVRRHFPVSPQRVFAAFADAALVAQWLTPSPDVGLTVRRFDFREGGEYCFVYALPNATTVTVVGVYHAIQAPSRLVFSWKIEPPDPHAGIDSEVTVTILPAGDGTELTIRHAWPAHPDVLERHDAGWRGALSHLKLMLARPQGDAT